MNKLIILTLLILVSCDNMCQYANTVCADIQYDLPYYTTKNITRKYNKCVAEYNGDLIVTLLMLGLCLVEVIVDNKNCIPYTLLSILCALVLFMIFTYSVASSSILKTIAHQSSNLHERCYNESREDIFGKIVKDIYKVNNTIIYRGNIAINETAVILLDGKLYKDEIIVYNGTFKNNIPAICNYILLDRSQQMSNNDDKFFVYKCMLMVAIICLAINIIISM